MSKALVLSGGGPLAVAWECGVIAGLAHEGITLLDADFFLGTSAGAIVSAQIATGRDPASMVEAILAESDYPPEETHRIHYPPTAIAKLPEMFRKAHTGDLGRIEVGAYALESSTPDSLNRYVERMSSMVNVASWPDTIGVVAVEAATGQPKVLLRDCGASLGTAVAASCSLPGLTPPVPISGQHFMDGGLRSSANADLVGPLHTILIISFAPPGPVGQRMTSRVTAQAEELKANGASVLVITPDDRCQEAIGSQTMDFSRRPEIARQGQAQGVAIASRLAQFWR